MAMESGRRGDIILSDTGQYVIYQAPLEFPKGKDSLDIKITLRVFNPKGREDPEKKYVAEKVLRIYRPGILQDYPLETWLPKDDNTTNLKSALVYRSGENWLPAFDHMSRIQYFELAGVSKEKGKCMNDPVPDEADECFDLQLKKDDNLEVFAAPKPVKGKCTLTDQFMQARTGKPVKEFTLKVYSLDFGSYGFLRSFANINKGGKDSIKGEKPVYVSVPWTNQNCPHVHKTYRYKKDNDHQDNRVTIPLDIDEDHVADKGWETLEGKKVEDPMAVFNVEPTEKQLKDAKRKGEDLTPENDQENVPLGDGFKGDGLGSYEEYRGFKIISDKKIVHTRTDPEIKDIFICNEGDFHLETYKKVSGLGVYEITKEQFIDVGKRWINFNYSPNTIS